MFIAPSHPGRPAPLGAGCKLNTKTHGAPPERWANLGSSGMAVKAPNILCHQCAKAS
jgi:hypothetical protein